MSSAYQEANRRASESLSILKTVVEKKESEKMSKELQRYKVEIALHNAEAYERFFVAEAVEAWQKPEQMADAAQKAQALAWMAQRLRVTLASMPKEESDDE